MIVFSEVLLSGKNASARGLVSGKPTKMSDFEGWTFFDTFISKCDHPCRFKAHVTVWGYGDREGGVFDATPAEVAYMLQRIESRPDFLEARCERLSEYKVDLDTLDFTMQNIVEANQLRIDFPELRDNASGIPEYEEQPLQQIFGLGKKKRKDFLIGLTQDVTHDVSYQDVRKIVADSFKAVGIKDYGEFNAHYSDYYEEDVKRCPVKLYDVWVAEINPQQQHKLKEHIAKQLERLRRRPIRRKAREVNMQQEVYISELPSTSSTWHTLDTTPEAIYPGYPD